MCFGIFLTFRLNVRNTLQNTVSLAEHCYGFEQCYEQLSFTIIVMWDWQHFVDKIPHIQTKCGNIPQNIVNPTKYCYASE